MSEFKTIMTVNKKIISHSAKQAQDYEKSLLSVIKKIEKNRHQAITTANKLLVDVYLHIGQTITVLQEKSKWGDGVVEKMSQDLRLKYPEQKGFSVQNLWRMKKLHDFYKDKPILSPLAGEISWTNNVLILDNAKTIEEK